MYLRYEDASYMVGVKGNTLQLCYKNYSNYFSTLYLNYNVCYTLSYNKKPQMLLHKIRTVLHKTTVRYTKLQTKLRVHALHTS